MSKTLIVPVDGSKTADHAFRCAQVLAAHLDLSDIVVMTASRERDDSLRAHLEALVREADDPHVRPELVSGSPAASIVRMTTELDDPIVCMSTRGRGRLSAPVLGSVATEVVRRVEGPVLLVGPRCDADWWRTPTRLVACWADESSAAVLAPAQDWSDALGAELWLETVLRAEDVRADFDPQRVFAPALAHLGTGPGELHLVVRHHQTPARAIVRSALEIPATLLAMTTHATVGFERAVLGSVATQVVRESPCPVLVVRVPDVPSSDERLTQRQRPLRP